MKSANSLVMSCSTFLYSLPFAALFYLTINALQFDDMRSIIAFSSIGLIPIVGWFALGWQLPLPKRKDLLRKPVQQSLITYESRSLPLDSRSYTETLPDGGTLHVSRDRWSISYIFPGPDRRYNSTFYSIDGPKVEAFINALVEGWAEGERLQTIAPESGSLSKTGKEDVGIHASSNHVSVYLPNIRISVHSKDELEKLVSMYQYARDRAREMAQYLSQI